jgi:hypothetical protein
MRSRKRPASVVAGKVPKAKKGNKGVKDEAEAATVAAEAATAANANAGSDPATETDADGSASAALQCEYPTCTAFKREKCRFCGFHETKEKGCRADFVKQDKIDGGKVFDGIKKDPDQTALYKLIAKKVEANENVAPGTSPHSI